MSDWKVTWFDGAQLRETIVPMCDAYNVVSMASSQGVTTWSILKIERIAKQ
jgi:hypothetical protein